MLECHCGSIGLDADAQLHLSQFTHLAGPVLSFVAESSASGSQSVVGVLDKPYSQLIPLSGVAVQARQSTLTGTGSILCSLAGQYGNSAEWA